MRKITISAIQMDIESGNLKTNMEKALKMMEKAANRGSDIITLPEMWPVGFDYEAMSQLPESYLDDILEFLTDIAFKHKTYIVSGTICEPVDGNRFNTCFLIDPAGKITGKYRKIHLFKEIGERNFFSPGWDIGYFDTHLAKIGIAICYDLRFPEVFRQMALSGAEVIFVPAQFPHPRLEHWDVLLRARAIENQLFVVGCNRVGKMEKIEYFGHSMIIGPYGDIIEEAGDGEELITEVIDLERLYNVRKVLPSLSERRPEVYTEMPSKKEPAAPLSPLPPLSAKESAAKPFKFKNTIQPMKPRQ